MKCSCGIVCILLIFSVTACKQSTKISSSLHFSLLQSVQTGVTFANNLSYDIELNPYTYRNFYNGGGVAIGDINNDGLEDIYFTGNQVANKLYLNLGDFKFKDITALAGVACDSVWSTGASIVDINGDGWLDIYVCKAGPPHGPRRSNELFINNGDQTFTESAKDYGLDFQALCVHSAFFDYDLDGDLDCYLLSNSIRAVGGFDLRPGLREIPDPQGNKLLRNDDGVFTDVSTEAGIFSSNIGYGLGITISDFDHNGWPDLFISNDFFERDYLYLNQGNGTFTEEGASSFASMSMGSMGADAVDLNGDLQPDLFVTEMLPISLERRRTKAQYENWDKYQSAIRNGYHHQYGRNALQLNNHNGPWMEIGRASGVADSEWSWSALIQDFDNDGLRDIFVSNGIGKDLLDRDYLNFVANETVIKTMKQNNEAVFKNLIDSMPSEPVANRLYKQVSHLQFSDVAADWGLGQPNFSNGSAYADLDNDGDLDLIISQIDAPAAIYKNNSSDHNYLQISLSGKGNNTKALGSRVTVYTDSLGQMLECYTSKGFQSTVTSLLHFGLGDHQTIDSVVVNWPDGSQSILKSLSANQRIVFDWKKKSTNQLIKPRWGDTDEDYETINQIDWKHEEPLINQFAREPLAYRMSGYEGPALAVADFNSDGIDDLFVGGGKGQSSKLWLSNARGFDEIEEPFEENKAASVTSCQAYDIDQDGDLDIYVGHGHSNDGLYAGTLHDVWYQNDGTGRFEANDLASVMPKPLYTGAVHITDLDNDGLTDILIGEYGRNDLYGLSGDLIRLERTQTGAWQKMEHPDMVQLGIITDIYTYDINLDGSQDIIAVGEWMPITIFYQERNGNFSKESVAASSGLWHTMYPIDLDQDGDMDFLLGNEGINTLLEPPLTLCIADFDQNGTKESLICHQEGDEDYPIHEIDDMRRKMPSTKKRYLKYKDYAAVSIGKMFDEKVVASAIKKPLDILASVTMWNDQGNLRLEPLEYRLQWSSIHTFYTYKSGDDLTIVAGGNDDQIQPQFGRQDASSGWVWTMEGSTYSTPKPLFVDGQIRSIALWNEDLLLGRNGEHLMSIKQRQSKKIQ